MNTQEYCANVSRELSVWKQKIDTAVRRLDSLSSRVKENVLPNIEDVHILSAELDERIRQLETECLVVWQAPAQADTAGHTDMRSRYDETLKIIGRAAPVSIAG